MPAIFYRYRLRILGNLSGRLAIPAAIYRSAPGPGLKVHYGVLFEQFWAAASERPKPQKNGKKRSKSTLWGTPRQVPKIAPKALRSALSGPGPGALL